MEASEFRNEQGESKMEMVKFAGLHVVHVEAKASVMIDEVHLSQGGSVRRRCERGFGR